MDLVSSGGVVLYFKLFPSLSPQPSQSYLFHFYPIPFLWYVDCTVPYLYRTVPVPYRTALQRTAQLYYITHLRCNTPYCNLISLFNPLTNHIINILQPSHTPTTTNFHLPSLPLPCTSNLHLLSLPFLSHSWPHSSLVRSWYQFCIIPAVEKPSGLLRIHRYDRWDEMRWDGIGSDGMGWDGMGCDVMGSDEIRWDGMR